MGATLGRQFSYTLIQASSQRDEEVLQRDLKLLVNAELLYQRGVPPHATYQFKHALIQEAAYESLLRSTRRYYHQRIARVLTTQFPNMVETQPELAAHHYTEADLFEEAVAYWKQAGWLAQARSAHEEAIAHLNQGLQALINTPETSERDQLELALYIDLGRSLTVTKGWAAPETEAAYVRAGNLGRETSDRSQLAAALWGLSHMYIVRADLAKFREVETQIQTLAAQESDELHLMAAQWHTVQLLCYVGEYAASVQRLEQLYTLYDPQQHPTHEALFGVDIGVFALSYMSHALWGAGYAEQAVHRSNEALALALEIQHPFSMAMAHAYAAMLYQFRQEPLMASQHAERQWDICTEQGFTYYLAWATIIQGWAMAEQGQQQAGTAQMQQGLADLQATGGGLRLPYYLALLAEAHGRMGQVETGLDLIAEAFATMRQSEECRWEAMLYRLQGDLLLARSTANQATAEASLRQGLDAARRQQAKSLELRAAVSLARLWQSQGKGQDAYDLLAPVYNWFTEDFATVDLHDAKALLATLTPPPSRRRMSGKSGNRN